MNEKNTQYLYNKYPEIFADKDKPMTETCMCWGFECGDGWVKILDALCGNIQWWVDNPQWICKDPIWLQRVKRLCESIIWNRATLNFLCWCYLKNVPSTYICGCSDAPKYDAQWKKFYKWQSALQFPSKCVPPPFNPYRQVKAEQVKEKFGTLRFYYLGGDEYISGLVRMAEAMSAITCEECGSTDDTVKKNPGNWIAIRCDKCRKAAKKKQAKV